MHLFTQSVPAPATTEAGATQPLLEPRPGRQTTAPLRSQPLKKSSSGKGMSEKHKDKKKKAKKHKVVKHREEKARKPEKRVELPTRMEQSLPLPKDEVDKSDQ